MYTRIYKYNIAEKDYLRWMVMTKETDAMMKKFPAIKLERHVRKKGHNMEIEEALLYESEDLYKRAMEEIKKNERANALTDIFLNMVQGEIQEDFIKPN